MPTAEKQLAFARRALGKARTDLALARLVLQRGPDMEPWVAAFHAQQAAEKAITALLIARWIQPSRTHDLRELAESLPADALIPADPQELGVLSEYSSDVRYAGPLEQTREPTWAQAEAAVALAGRILEAATSQIRGK
jgi:HEPN domain-containing protein